MTGRLSFLYYFFSEVPCSFDHVNSKSQIMETTTITEFVQFEKLETTTDEQLIDAVNRLNKFQGKQDGYLDAEIARNMKDDSWSIIFHYEDMEKVQAIGATLRSSQEFMDFSSLIVTDSLRISFCRQLKTW